MVRPFRRLRQYSKRSEPTRHSAGQKNCKPMHSACDLVGLEPLFAKCLVLIHHKARIRSKKHQPWVSSFVGGFFLRRFKARSIERGLMVTPKRCRTAATMVSLPSAV